MTTNEGKALSEDTVLTAPKVTVGFERKVQVRDYESAVASIYIEAPTKPGDGPEEIVAAAHDAFFAAKSVVFEQLGIVFETTVDGKAVEMLEKQLGAVEVTRAEEAQAVAAASTPTASSNGNGPAPTSKDGLWAELSEFPKRYFDNRASKAERGGNGPDFKRKQTNEGLWLTYRGKSNVPAGVRIPEPSEF